MNTRDTIDDLLRRRDWTRNLAFQMVHDAHDADDIAQDAALAVLQHRPQGIADPNAWLARVVRNLAHRRHRSQRRREQREQAAANAERTPATAMLAERADAHRQLIEHVLALAPAQRDVLLSRYFQGLSPRAIAKRDHCAVSTVSNRLTKAHAALRHQLSAKEGEASAWIAGIAPLLAPGLPETSGTGVAAAKLASASAASAGVIAWLSAKSTLIAGAALLLITATAVGIMLNGGGPEVAARPLPVTPLAQESQEQPALDPSRPPASNRQAVAAREASVAAPLPATLACSVLDRKSGNGVDSVEIRLTPLDASGAPRDGATPTLQTTDATGSAAFETLPAGVYVAALLRDGAIWHEPEQPLRLHAGTTREETWRIALHAQIQGSLVNERGEPLANTTVTLAHRGTADREWATRQIDDRRIGKTKTDVTGAFHFDAVPPGRYVVGPDPDRFLSKVDKNGKPYRLINTDGPPAILELAVVPPNVDVVTVHLRISPHHSIRGAVRYPDGRPANNVYFSVRHRDTAGYRTAMTGEDGKFSIRKLPAGNCSLRCYAAPDGYGVFETVRAKAGDQDLKITLQPAGSMHCSLISPSPELIPGHVMLWAEPNKRGFRNGSSTRITANGEDDKRTATFSEKMPSTYSVAFVSIDQAWCGLLSDVVVQPGQHLENVQVPIQPAAWLDATNENASTTYDLDITVDGTFFTIARIAPGTTERTAVPPGSITIEVEDRSTHEKSTHRVECRAGKPTVLTIGGS